MDAGRFEDAARDFGAAYDLAKDPVLFFKIAHANQSAGRCDLALVYYGRYLKEANPSAAYVALTERRMHECGAGSGSGTGTGSGSGTGLGSGSGSGSGGGTGSGSGSSAPAAAPAPAAPRALAPSPSTNAAWLFVGGSLAAVTLGTVLAYSASSSQEDLKDLYLSPTGVSPTYDATTAQRYHDLLSEGHRYAHLSWAAFGIAGACAAGAAYFFVRAHHGEHLAIAPVAAPHAAGLAASGQF
jgi:hypothetical protein